MKKQKRPRRPWREQRGRNDEKTELTRPSCQSCALDPFRSCALQVTPGRLRSPSTARLRVFDQDGARELPGETFTDSVLLGSDPSRCGVLALGSGVAKEHVRVVYQPNKGGFSLHPLSGQTIQCAVSAYPKLLEALRSEAKRLPLPSQKRREVLQRLQDIEDQQRGSMLCNPIDGRKRLTPLFSAFTVGRAEPREPRAARIGAVRAVEPSPNRSQAW
eukprot:g28828.t1